MRRFVVSFFATILTFPFLYIVIFHLQCYFVQQEMLEKIKEQQLITIQIPIENLHWNRIGKEIVIEGELFDVESITYHNNKATICGLYDLQETRINEQLSSIIDRQQDKGKSFTLFKLLGFFSMLFDQTKTLQFTSITNISANYIDRSSLSFTNNYLKVPTPPPLD